MKNEDSNKEIDFKTVCDHLTACIYLTDVNEKTLYVNQAYLEHSGLSREDIVGYTIDEIRQKNIFKCNIHSMIKKTGQSADAIGYIPRSDRYMYVIGVPIKDEAGNIKYILTTDRESSELLEVENQLLHLKEEHNHNIQELKYYREQDSQSEIIYISNAMKNLLDTIHIIAPTDVTVLLTGESGTGKELLANTIYNFSKRKGEPYVKINCAAIPSELLESELFGYEEGAFTGARKGGKAGVFELADHGTLFLDEIGELPFQVQAKLLRALQENEIIRIGGYKPIKLDIRIIAATNKNLKEAVKNGKFREDLYYRLNVLPIKIPALRDRISDIPLLISKFIEDYGVKYKKSVALENGSMDLFKKYQWPGNVRELKNLIERLVVINTTGIISKDIIQRNLGIEEMTHECKTLKEAVMQTEKSMIQKALAEHGSKRKAAAALGVDSSTIVKKCKLYNIDNGNTLLE